jgi:hypothetical protein
MIESISIKSVASYDTEGVQITDLKKVNFIYGTNPNKGKILFSQSNSGDVKVEVRFENQLTVSKMEIAATKKINQHTI